MIEYEDIKQEHDKGHEVLKQMKELERSQKVMFRKTLGDGTVIFCNKEENLDRYDGRRSRLW